MIKQFHFKHLERERYFKVFIQQKKTAVGFPFTLIFTSYNFCNDIIMNTKVTLFIFILMLVNVNL